MGPLAVASFLLLTLLTVSQRAPAVLLVLFASGACACFQMAANAAFVVAAPPKQRSQAFGLAQAGMYLGQGGAVIVAGAAAARFAPPIVVAVSGTIGTAAALILTVCNRRQS
jgi:predicted MFS family arabinose efflux permease